MSFVCRLNQLSSASVTLSGGVRRHRAGGRVAHGTARRFSFLSPFSFGDGIFRDGCVPFLKSRMEFVRKQVYRYNLLTGLYMLDWWERALFNVVAASFTVVTGYYGYQYYHVLTQ